MKHQPHLIHQVIPSSADAEEPHIGFQKRDQHVCNVGSAILAGPQCGEGEEGHHSLGHEHHEASEQQEGE